MTETTTPEAPTVTTVRLVATYQLFGDCEGDEWMNEALALGVENGDLKAFDVTGSHPGPFGIQLVTFTVDVGLGERFKPEHSYEETKEVGTALLNTIIGDSDVEVLWVSPVMP